MGPAGKSLPGLLVVAADAEIMKPADALVPNEKLWQDSRRHLAATGI